MGINYHIFSDVCHDMTCNTHRKTFHLSVLCVLFLFLSLFFSIYFPIVGNSFDYWHMAVAIRISNSGYIDPGHINVGYYILTTVIHEIVGIPYEVIPTLPLQSVSFILLYGLLVRSISLDYDTPLLTILLGTIYLFKFGTLDAVSWWTHGVGFILSLFILYISILRLSSSKNQPQISILLIILIISVSFISYKMTLFSLSLLFTLQFIEWLQFSNNWKTTPNRSKFTTVILIGGIFFFIFNKIVYDEFIPRLRVNSEFSTSSLDKLFMSYEFNQVQPLSQYYFRTPALLRTVNTLWVFLVFIGLICLCLILVYIYIKRGKYYVGEKAIISILLSSTILFIIYSLLGANEISLLIFTGILGFSLISRIVSKNVKYVIFSTMFLLLVLSLCSTTISYHESFFDGMRDINYCQYLNSPSEYYIKNMINDGNNCIYSLKSDVFTGGYFCKQIARENLSYSYEPLVFSDENMLFLFRQQALQKVEPHAFIINYRLKRFYSMNWETFISWSEHRSLIENNPYLNIIYSSGDVSIFVTRLNF